MASATLPRDARAYLTTATGDGTTVRANRAALDAWRIVPRLSNAGLDMPDVSIQLCGTPMSAPIMIGPLGLAALADPDADHALAAGAAEAGVSMVLASCASMPLETAAAEHGVRWFELIPTETPAATIGVLDRAAGANYSAVMIALDMPPVAWRPEALHHLTAASAAAQGWSELTTNPALNWDMLALIRESWTGTVALKGILSAEDARRAMDFGVDVIVVSNHGGCHAEGALGSAAALPDVVDAVDERIPVLMDSGIRDGTDIAVSLALGARAVLIGHAALWGVALGGATGVRQVLDDLRADLGHTLASTGHTLTTLDHTALQPLPGGSHG